MRKTLPLLLLGVLLTCQCSSRESDPAPVDETAALTRGPLGTLEWEPDSESIKALLAAHAAPEESEAATNEANAGPVTGAAAPGAPASELRSLGYTDGDSGGELDSLADARYRHGASIDAFHAASAALELAKEKKGSGATEPRTWRRAGAAVNATTLRVGDDDELPLLGVEASVWVDGFRARVLMDCVYRNVHEQQLEGTFKLRLPEGATPYYLAFGEEVIRDDGEWTLPARDRSLDTGPEPESVTAARAGHWKGAREARMVPRAKAARAYKDTVRQKVDPALLEWAGAGVFQARVFPLLPGAVHRVVVGYELDLVPVPRSKGTYELGLAFPADLPALSLDLHVLAPAGAVVAVEPRAAHTRASGQRLTHSFPATPQRDFRVRLSPIEGAALVSGEDTGYFAVDLQPRFETVGWAGSPTAVFVIDTSLSSANGRFETWLELLEAILENNRESLAEFAVLFFDVTPRWWREGPITNDAAAVAELRAYAERLALEGASDLGSALREASRPSWMGIHDGPTWDLFLLSDGAATWGARDLHALSAARRIGGTGPLFAYTTGLGGTDRRALEHLARESGGAVFTVTGPDEIPAASTAHHGAPWTIQDLHVPGGSDLLLRGRPSGVFPGQRLRLVGRGAPRAGEEIELRLAQGGRTRTLSFPIAATLDTPLAARAYGEVATQQLEEFGRTTREPAEAFATRFRVPGQACSLLMLESEEDYAEHGFLPEAEIAVARGTPAGPLVAAALERLAGLLEDPARALFELLEPLLETGLELDPELVSGLTRLEREALEIQPEALSFEALDAALIPDAVTEMLHGGEPDYLQLQEEARRRRESHELGDAVRALSSLVELNPGDIVFTRDTAQILMQWELFGHAYPLYLRAAEARPFEPQSYLALARCAQESGQGDLALAWYTVALEGEWDERFGDFHRIAAFDALHFLRRVQRRELSLELDDWAAARVGDVVETVGMASADLAIAIEWNTDATDVDLHVVEPSGEHCYFGHRDTALGAHLSRDVTQGLGPELYVLPEAVNGEYLVYVHYFGGDPAKTAVRSKVLATLYERWGSEEELLRRRVIRLESAREEHGVVRITVER